MQRFAHVAPAHESKGDAAMMDVRRGGSFNKCLALVDLIVEERWADTKALAISLDCKSSRC